MPNRQNLTVRIPPNPLLQHNLLPITTFRKPPISRLQLLQSQFALKPRAH